MATTGNHLFHRPEECDSFQPCFFEHETDVEFYGTRAPMPSDEIWDKFELLLTPPRSPNREPLGDLHSSLLDDEAERLHLSPLSYEDLITGFQEELLPPLPKPLPFPESPPTSISVGGLNSKLIQDCMWSGRSLYQTTADICVEKKVSDKNGITGTGSCASRRASRSDSVSGVDINLSTDCVDPTAVFPYPINVNRDYLEMDTPSDSGNEEEEDEEIDVVNVEKVNSTHLPTRRKIHITTVPGHTVVKAEYKAASLLLPAVHACHTYSKQIPPGRDYPSSRSATNSPVHGHSYQGSNSLKRTSDCMSRSPQSVRPTPAKRSKRQLTTPAELRKVVQKLKDCGSGRKSKPEYYSSSSSSSCSSRLGSDSEGESCGKRTQHNVLERKRRNDLKYSFFKLRDAVPELCQQERAPKVVILKKATDYINELTFRSDRIVPELEKLKARHEELKQTLRLLQM